MENTIISGEQESVMQLSPWLPPSLSHPMMHGYTRQRRSFLQKKKLNIRKKTKSRAIQRDRGRNRGKKKLVIQNFASDCFSWLCQKSGGELPIFYSELYIRYNSAQCQCSVRKFLAPTRSLRNANVGLCVRPSVRPVQTCLVWAENTSSCSCKMPNVCHM